MNDMVNERFSNQRAGFSLRLKNSLMIDIDDISNSVIRAAEDVASSLSYGLPKSIYQLKLFNLLSRQGFKLQTQKSELRECQDDEGKKEIIVVNEMLVIQCVVQEDSVSDSQRRMMFDHDNDFVNGVIINFGGCKADSASTRVYQNSVLH